MKIIHAVLTVSLLSLFAGACDSDDGDGQIRDSYREYRQMVEGALHPGLMSRVEQDGAVCTQPTAAQIVSSMRYDGDWMAAEAAFGHLQSRDNGWLEGLTRAMGIAAMCLVFGGGIFRKRE